MQTIREDWSCFFQYGALGADFFTFGGLKADQMDKSFFVLQQYQDGGLEDTEVI